MPQCVKCNDTGIWQTGNNDLPCDCFAGGTAVFNTSKGSQTGAEIRQELGMTEAKPPKIQRVDMSSFLYRDLGDFVLWFFIDAITKAGGEDASAAMRHIMAVRSEADQKGSIFHVEFRVEGIDLPFLETMRELETQHDEMLARKAQKLVKERLGDHLETFNSLVRRFRQDCQDKLGVDGDEYDQG